MTDELAVNVRHDVPAMVTRARDECVQAGQIVNADVCRRNAGINPQNVFLAEEIARLIVDRDTA